MSLTPGQKSGKKRTKLEKLMRQDHSDVYFDNEKLNDELNNRIEFMQREMHKHDIQRGIEIGKLRKEINELKAIRTSSAENQLQQISLRPQTAGNINNRHKTIFPEKRRAKTAIVRSDSRSVDENSDAGTDENQPPERSYSPTSSISTLRNTKKLKNYQLIGPQSFKDNNRYPEEWYTKCLPASDAALYNARKKVRGKSAPPQFEFLGKIREKEEMERKLLAYTKTNIAKQATLNNNMSEADGQKMTLICEEPVKPILMSLRRLKELSNVDNLVERGPSRNTELKQNIKEHYAIEKKRLEHKVRDFCTKIEDLKSSEAKAFKEKEEARKREALEELYLKSVEIDKAEPAAEDDSDNDDAFWKNKWRK